MGFLNKAIKGLIPLARVLAKSSIKIDCLLCHGAYNIKSMIELNDKLICKKCHRAASRKIRAIYLTEQKIEYPLTFKKNLNNFNKIIEIANELKRYEDLGLDIVSPLPSELIKNWKAKEEEILFRGFEVEVYDAIEKSKTDKSLSVKISHFNKILGYIENYKNKINDKEKLNALLLKVNKLKNDIKINIFNEDASKTGIKKNNKNF